MLHDFYARHLPGQALGHFSAAPGGHADGAGPPFSVLCHGERRGDATRLIYATLHFATRPGVELVFHLLAGREALAEGGGPPTWPVEVLDNLHAYVARTGLALRGGDHSRYDQFPCAGIGGLIYLPSQTVPAHLDGPGVRREFLDALALSLAELDLVRAWSAAGVGRVLREAGLLPWTRPAGRPCLMRSPELAGFRTYCEAMADAEGADTGVLSVRLAVSVTGLRARCAVRPDDAAEVRTALSRRLRLGRPLALESFPRGAARRDVMIAFQPAPQEALAWDVEHRVLRVQADEAHLGLLAERLLRSLDGPPTPAPVGGGELLFCWS